MESDFLWVTTASARSPLGMEPDASASAQLLWSWFDAYLLALLRVFVLHLPAARERIGVGINASQKATPAARIRGSRSDQAEKHGEHVQLPSSEFEFLARLHFPDNA